MGVGSGRASTSGSAAAKRQNWSFCFELCPVRATSIKSRVLYKASTFYVGNFYTPERIIIYRGRAYV